MTQGKSQSNLRISVLIGGGGIHEKKMKISVVVPTFGDAHLIEKMLERQTFIEKGGEVELCWVNNVGYVNAMNAALTQITGDIMVRIDDDVALPKEWLEELVSPFAALEVVGVTGPTFVPKELRQNRDSIAELERIVNSKGFLHWLLCDFLMEGEPFAPARIFKCGSTSYGSNYEEHLDKTKTYKIDHFEGTNWACRTALIREVGGWDEAYGGLCEWSDDDFEFKILKKGGRIVYNPNAWLYHLLQVRTASVGSSPAKRVTLGISISRICNLVRFHWRHRRLNLRFFVYLMFVISYYVWRSIWKQIRDGRHQIN